MSAAAGAAAAGGSMLLSGVAGGMAAGNEAKRAKKYYSDMGKNYKDLQGEVDTLGTTRMGEVDTAYDPYIKDFGANAQDYFSALKDTDYSKFDLTDPGEFDFDMQAEIQRQLNPQLDAMTGRAADEIQQSAANRGGLFSGATAKGIARSTQDIAAREWGNARDAAQTERTNKYQQWTDKFNQAAKIAEQNRSNMQAGLNNKGTLFSAQGDMFGAARTEKSGIQNATDTSKIQLRGQEMEANTNAASQPGYWSAFGSGALSGLAGGAAGAANLYGAMK